MKFIILKSNLKEAISYVEKISGENINFPILKNVLIEARDENIYLTTTNLEIAITSIISGKVMKEGKITIPVNIFSNLISNITSDRLNIEQKDNTIELKTDNYNAILQGFSADDFPITPKIKDYNNLLTINGLILKEALQQVLVASQVSDLRPELSSVLLNFSIDDLKFVSTDGFRLAEKIIQSNLFSIKNKEPFKILIPIRTSQEILRIIKDDDIVNISFDDNQILFKTDSIELISRIINGSFPDYSQLISNKFNTEIILNKEDFLNAIKLTSVFGQKNNEVGIKINETSKNIEISSSDQSFGENNYIISSKIKGESSEIFFNWKYLSSALKAIKSEDVFIGIGDEMAPALIRGNGDNSYVYILKPIMKSN